MILAVAAESEAETLGRYFGTGFILLLLAALAAKCIAMSFRPTTNRAALLGLAAMVLSWVLASASTLRELLPAIGQIAGWWMALGLLCLQTLGVGLAIVGLIQMAARPGVWIQGKRQAVIALLLSLPCLVGAFIGFAGALGRALKVASTPAVAGGNAGSEPTLTFEGLNFRMQVPPRPWTRLDASKISKDITVAFLRGSPQTTFFLIAEKDDAQSRDSEGLSQHAIRHLKQQSPDATILETAPYAQGGVSGVRFVAQTGTGQGARRYVYLCIARGPYLYQMWTTSDLAAQSKEALDADAAAMFRRFSLIDPSPPAPAVARQMQDFASPRFHYKVKAVGSGWSAWDDLEKDFPSAELGMIYRDHAAFIVVPVSLLGEKLDMPLVTKALVSRLGVTYPGENIHDLRTLSPPDPEGYEFTCERNQGDQVFSCSVRSMRKGGIAYLVASWVGADAPDDATTAAREIFDLFEIGDGAAPAPVAADLDERERKRHALFFNQVGLALYTSELYGRSVTYFTKARELNPGDPVLSGNLADAHAAMGRDDLALAALDAGLASLKGDGGLLCKKAAILARQGKAAAALGAYADAFAGGHRDDEAMEAYARLLSQQGRADEALERLVRYMGKEEPRPLRLLQASLLSRNGSAADAVRLLREMQRDHPFDPEIARAMVAAHYAAGDHLAVLSVIQELTDAGDVSAETMFLRGRSELALGRLAAAKASLEEVLRHQPEDDDARELLATVRSRLGEGDTTLALRSIPPVDVAAELRRPADDAPCKGHDACVESRIEAFAFAKSSPLRHTTYLRVRMNASSAVPRYGELQFRFDPLSEEICANSVRVLDEAGAVMAIGKSADLYVLDKGDASDDKVLHIPITGLAPRRVLDVAITIRDKAAADAMPFRSVVMTSADPVLRYVVTVAGEVQDVALATTGAVESGACPGAGPCRYLEARAPQRYEDVPYLPAVDRIAPVAWLGSRAPSWPELASSYMASIEPQLRAVATVEEKAKALTKGLEGDAAKAAALVHLVRTDVTYRALEFGKRGRIPAPPADVLRKGFGDCKDLTILLLHLFRAVGIPCDPALVSTGLPIRRDLPSLDQFNHMVLYCPSLPMAFVDPTDRFLPLTLAPFELGGRDALVLAAPARFERIPAYGTSEVRVDRRITLGGGDAEVVEEDAVGGYLGASLKSWAAEDDSPAARRRMAEEILGDDRDVEVERVELAPSSDAEPFRMKVAYLVHGTLRAADASEVGRLTASLERYYLQVPADPERALPSEMPYPVDIESRVALAAREGWRLQPLAGDVESAADSRYVTWSRTSRGPEEWTFHASRPALWLDASEYAACQKAMAHAIEAAGPRFDVRREGTARAQAAP